MNKTKTKNYWLKYSNLPERYEDGQYKKLYIVDRQETTPFKYGIIAELEDGTHQLIAASTNKNWIYSIRAAIDLDTEHIYSDNEIYPEFNLKK